MLMMSGHSAPSVYRQKQTDRSSVQQIRPLHDPVTWYKVAYAGEQVAQWDFQTKAGRCGLVRVALFWKSHCGTCSPACVILYHMTALCKKPIVQFRSFLNIKAYV